MGSTYTTYCLTCGLIIKNLPPGKIALKVKCSECKRKEKEKEARRLSKDAEYTEALRKHIGVKNAKDNG